MNSLKAPLAISFLGCLKSNVKLSSANAILINGFVQNASPLAACGACTMACPNGALSLSTIDKTIDGKIVSRNRIQYNPSACEQCGTCTQTCPYSMLKLTQEQVPLKGFCILYEQCIPSCPNTALSLK